MKIWTTYFAAIKKLPLDRILPISICGKPIEGWEYPQYKKLAPSWSIYKEYKDSLDQERYICRFHEEILGSLSREEVLKDLEELSQGKDVALVCYEKPGDFCHRHIVAEWLGNNIREYQRKTVSVFSKADFKKNLSRFADDPETAIISIECTPDCIKYRLEEDKGDTDNEHLLPESERVLNIDFDDVPGPGDKMYKDHWMMAIDGGQARKIVEFIEKNLGKNFVVHCKAGESRSRAVGEFILRWFGDEYSDGNPGNSISGACNIDVLTKLENAFYKIHHLYWHTDNRTSITKEAEDYAGRYINLKCFNEDYRNTYSYEDVRDEDIAYLVGAVDCFEDYFWVYIDRNFKLGFRSCCCGYGLVYDWRRFPGLTEEPEFMKQITDREGFAEEVLEKVRRDIVRSMEQWPSWYKADVEVCKEEGRPIPTPDNPDPAILHFRVW